MNQAAKLIFVVPALFTACAGDRFTEMSAVDSLTPSPGDNGEAQAGSAAQDTPVIGSPPGPAMTAQLPQPVDAVDGDAGNSVAPDEPGPAAGQSLDAGELSGVDLDAGLPAMPAEPAVGDAAAQVEAEDAQAALPDAGPPPLLSPCSTGAFAAPQLLDGIGLVNGLRAPAFAPDGLSLYFAARDDSGEDVYVAHRATRQSSFELAVPADVVNTAFDDGTPFVSADSLALYFYSTRGNAMSGRDLFVATRAHAGDPFDSSERLVDVNSPADDHLPRLSNDGLSLLFTTERAGGGGASDLWSATRPTPDGAFNAPVPLNSVNTASREEGGVLSPDRLTIYFASDRSYQEQDLGLQLWQASRSGRFAPFAAAEPLPAMNGGGEAFDPSLSADGRLLVFAADRDGAQELWQATRSCGE